MMSSDYEITLDDTKYKVSVERLDEGGILIVKVADECYTIKTLQTDEGTFIVNDTTNDFSIRLVKKTGSKLQLELDDHPLEVEWQRIVKNQVTAAPKATGGGGPKVAGGVYPPMPGKISEVTVSVGDVVKQGQTVCILEAMKMFNELKSSKAGTVKEVNVEQGSAVTPNDLLILIE
ncbi:MAG: biotin/lipoyl-containing protein [Candidatus Thorarchaeota archaeon]